MSDSENHEGGKAAGKAARAKLPPLDQKLVRAVARASWRVTLSKDDMAKSSAEKRGEWEKSKADHVAAARKLIRQLQRDGVSMSVAAE